MTFTQLYQALATALRASIEDAKKDTKEERHIIHFNRLSEQIPWKRFVTENNSAGDTFCAEARGRIIHANKKRYIITSVEKGLQWFTVTVKEYV